MQSRDNSNEQQNAAKTCGYEAFRASLREASPERVKRRKEFRQYFEQTKGKIEALSLVAVIIYAGLTFRLMEVGQDQLLTMRDQERRQLRAYIAIDGKVDDSHKGVFIRSPTKGFWEAWVGIVNTGETPAYDMRVYIQTVALPATSPIDPAYPAKLVSFGNTLSRGSNTLASRQVDREITPWEAVHLCNGTERIYVYGTVTYLDTFGTGHYTNFCSYFFRGCMSDLEVDDCPTHKDQN